MNKMIAGVLEHIGEMTVFMNPTDNSYERFGQSRAPRYISWSHENRSQLIRIPASAPVYKRAELRSPDPSANPYLAFALLIYAGLEGIENDLVLPPAVNMNLFTAPQEMLNGLKQLPESLASARKAAAESDFINKYLPDNIIDIYCNR